MRPQATGSNTLSGNIICLSVCPSIHPPGHLLAFFYFFICINFQCGGPYLRCIYPYIGVQRTPVGSSRAYMSVYLSVFQSLHLYLCLVIRVTFWRSKRMARNCAHRMRPQATGSNPLNGSIICPYIRPSGRPRPFNFLYLY